MEKIITVSKGLLCPSYVAEPGVLLLGTLNTDKKVDFLLDPIKIDKDFIDEAKKEGVPEAHFRFTSNCEKSSCQQWDKDGYKCGLVELIIDTSKLPIQAELQDCAIRSRCRWFVQEGAFACAICNETMRNSG